jgi:hypothetical protein
MSCDSGPRDGTGRIGLRLVIAAIPPHDEVLENGPTGLGRLVQGPQKPTHVSNQYLPSPLLFRVPPTRLSRRRLHSLEPAGEAPGFGMTLPGERSLLRRLRARGQDPRRRARTLCNLCAVFPQQPLDRSAGRLLFARSRGSANDPYVGRLGHKPRGGCSRVCAAPTSRVWTGASPKR